MLNCILQNVPPHWEQDSYSDKVFSLKEVGSASKEWEAIEENYFRMKPSKILRVQNPFTYGQYLFQKEELQNLSHKTVQELVIFQVVRVKDVEVIAEYNCNHRRIEGMSESFILSPPEILCSETAVLVIQALQNPPPKISYYYVKYVVYFQ